MNLTLPPKPNLVQLKKQAKNILKAHRAKDELCLPIVRRLRQFAELPDAKVFDGDLSLNDVQLALGLYYGYDGWANLKRHIENQEAEKKAPELATEPGAACIRGLENMDWGGSFYRRQDSYMAVLAAFLRCAGVKTSFEDVMGVSAGAFGMTVEDGICPSGGRISGECFDRVHRVFGLSKVKIDLAEGKDAAGVKRLRETVVESIDRGLPVPYMDGEYSLIVGYKNAGQTYICLSYAGGAGYQEMDFPRGMLGPAWFADVLKISDEPTDRSTAVLESLQAAVKMARTKRPGSGLAAYEKWIEYLEDAPEGTSLHGNAYCYAILLTNRAAAAEYLAAAATEFSGDVAAALASAGTRYRAISERLLAGRDCTAPPWKESWTAENRAIEAQIMRDNLADEQLAIAEIEKALVATK